MKDSMRQEIINRLTRPYTIKEMADEIGVTYKTVWRYITDLKNNHIVIEIPYGAGNANRYTLAKGTAPDNKFRVYVGKARYTGGIFIGEQTGEYAPHKAHSIMLGGALAHLALRSYLKRQNQDVWPNPVDVKDSLRRVLKFYKDQQNAIEQLLLSDIFDADRADIDLIFEINDIDTVREAALEFGDWKKNDSGPAA